MTKHLFLKKLETEKKSLYVIQQLFSAVSEGAYPVGSKLPSEEVIVRQTGVSRQAVREALSVLEFIGLIERHAGKGTYVRNTPPYSIDVAEAGVPVLMMLRRGENPLEVFDARRVLETGLVRKAVGSLSLQDIGLLTSSFDELANCVAGRDFDRLVLADRTFHMCIAQAVGNTLLEEGLRSCFGIMERELWREMRILTMRQSNRYWRESLECHRQILEALKTADTEEAITSINHHFDILDKRYSGLSVKTCDEAETASLESYGEKG